MKNKKLLLVVLALAIVTSLTAGTLAIYTKTVTMTGQVEAKKFAFTADGNIENDAEAINLAPTESMDYLFVVTNLDGKTPAEVPLKYNVAIDFSKASDNMPGLTATLYEKKTANGEYEVVATGNSTITYNDATEANTAAQHDYKLTLTWSGTDNDGQTVAGTQKVTYEQGLNVTVAAEQAV
ncbi:MAG: hypothetical protein GX418_13370 [Clostridiales bacterium]|nr:hypothetical protein [Clostridiales bacterium]